jgi:dTDP-4-amino-4,6-dideoxygalactose transaminase
MAQAVTPRTVAVVFAFVHGIIYDIDKYVEPLKKLVPNIDILEDVAQSF